jgi:hypothetical protein
MPSLSPEQLKSALTRMAADEAEDSFGAAVTQVVVHGDQRFAPVAVVLTALGAAGAGLDEAAAVALLQTAGAEIENKATSFPGFKRFFLPTLACLADEQPRSKKAMEPLVAKSLRLSPSLCASTTKKNGELRLQNKVHFSCVYLNAAGLIKSITRGVYTITPTGQELLTKGLREIDQKYLADHYPSFLAFQTGTKKDEADDTATTIWLLGSGNNGSMRQDFLAQNYVGIDFGIRVNLATATEAEVDEAFQRHGDETKDDNRKACLDFSEEMEPGDYVLLKDGRSIIAAYGRIEGDYEYKASAESYSHQRKVVWLSTQELKIPREHGMLALKTLTEAKPSNPAVKYALAYYRDNRANKPVWLVRPESPTLAFSEDRISFDWEGSDPVQEVRTGTKKMRPRFNFGQMQIPIGSKLQFIESDVQIDVIGNHKVSYENRERDLTEVTRTLKKLNHSVQPIRFWTYNGVNLLDIYNATYPRQGAPKLDDWRQDFLYEMQVGDLVLAATEQTNQFRVGEIMSTAQHDPERPTGRHWRTIQWRDQTIDSSELAELEEDPVDALDDEALPKAVSALLFPAKGPTAPDKLMQNKPTNLILFGPPGTGKTYVTAQHAVSICQGRPLAQLAAEDYRDRLMADYRKLCAAGNIAFVTFHQTYDYTDFVEGLRPQVTTDKRMTYELVPGVLRRLAALATSEQRQGEQFVIIIDEINRGNVSKILGELITLIESDKRLKAKNALEVTLPISGDTFGLPLNLHLIGTMNTADRSIALIDTALRRRFDFIAMDPKPEVLDSDTYVGDVKPSDFLRSLNTKLAGVFRDREHAIGHAWFMPDGDKPSTQEQVLKAFKEKVVPTLTEWLWDDPEKLREILGDVVDEYGKIQSEKLTRKWMVEMLPAQPKADTVA